MTPGHIAFWILAVMAVGSGAGVVLRRNPIHSALFLVAHLATVAALFLQMRAEFLAAAQVIVYAGAIMVLFVFAIMVLIPGKEETGVDPRRRIRLAALPVGAVLLVLLVIVVGRAAVTTGPVGAPGNVEAVGRLLFTDYLFPFELTSVLLLAAMVGVLLLARRRA
jgi:NADH-quinone oxidoreductase subunit J